VLVQLASTNSVPDTPAGDLSAVTETALEIRAFETKLLELFKGGGLSGTVHTCIGQEFCAAALHPHLQPGNDAFFATHRGHGHYLAHGGPADRLLAEMMGREGALCLGRGGTQNLLYKRFFSAGIQGGSAPIAVGYAWAMRSQGGRGIAVAQIGDGTLGEGTLYEAFTFAAWLRAPVLFLLEANGWAQSTDVRRTTPGNILQRAAGFGLEVDWKKDVDPAALYEHLGRVVEKVRGGTPFLQVIETRRLMAHSKGDDNRSPDLVAQLWRDDPLTQIVAREEDVRAAQRAAEARADQVVEEVSSRPLLAETDNATLPEGGDTLPAAYLHSDAGPAREFGRVAEELNRAFHEMMAAHPEVVLIGEDLLDPYGGAFKVSRGLSTKFPQQVLSSPIAEAGIVGVSNGMALAGLRPVAEIMFADFATLVADQLINFAAKFYYMYGGKARCPLTVRIVSGAGRGYGPTHSQSLERLFCGIPGLRVLALSQRHDAARLLTHAVLHDDGPKVFVENKLLYALRPMAEPPVDLAIVPGTNASGYAALQYQPRGNRAADVTVVTYGGMTGVAESAMKQLLADEESSFDYFVLTQLWPLDVTSIVQSVRRTRRLVVVEENVPEYSVGASVIAAVAQRCPEGFASRAVGAQPVPIPAVRHLEEKVLPSAAAVVEAVAALLRERGQR
jgi:2-oxoisovalerate dehydrogenase E1 component